MRTKTLTLSLMTLILSVIVNGTVQAKESAPPMSEEMQAMMAKVQKAGTPGAGHEKLQALVGEWKTATRSWMKPGDKAEKGTGTSSVQWVLDGRFLQQNYKGDWAGQPFAGLGFFGYDNVKEEYQSIWMDSMSTGIAEATGSYDAVTKTISDKGSVSCPISPTKTKDYRSEWKFISADKNIYNMYTKDEAGKEFKMMEIVYSRVK